MPYKDVAERRARHAWRLENQSGYREQYNAKMARNWRRRVVNPDKREAHRAKTRKWRASHLEQVREINRKSAAKRRLHQPAKMLAHVRKAQAARMKRCPPWADDGKITAVYAEAKRRTKIDGKEWHVDHVIPLQGKNVSGLHVYDNLQVLPGVENLKKNCIFHPLTWTKDKGWFS